MDQTQAFQPSVSDTDPSNLRIIAEGDHIRSILGALEDDFCRDILEVMSAEYQTAQQFSDACDMPISTTYRKLNTLEDVGLVDTSIRLRKSGHHTKEFALGYRSISVDLDHPDGTVLTLETYPRDE